MGLDAGNQDEFPAGGLQIACDGGIIDTAEAAFLQSHKTVEQFQYFGNGRPQALGVLLGNQHGQSQRTQTPDEQAGSVQQGFLLRNVREKAFLYVYDESDR